MDMKRFGLLFAVAFAIILSLSGSALAQTSSVIGILSSPYTTWFPIVIAGALLVLAVVSLIYMLAPLMGRNDLRAWARLQFYSVAFSMVLIVVFEVFGALIYTINPTPALNSIGLVPSACTGSSNLFGLALCNIYQFNQVTVNTLSYDVFVIGFRSAIIPSLSIGTNPVPGVSNLGVGFSFSLEPLSLSSTVGGLINALGVAYALNQVQLILTASSMLIFAVFMSIGLIARIFGITRSFGGAMIAFALGIGFIYPLMTSITYGFINTITSGLSAVNSVVTAMTIESAISPLIPVFFGLALAGNLALAAVVSAVASALAGVGISFTPVLVQFLEYFGLVGVGLLFVPLLNFIITDTFIVDFSQAVGEKMDFMSLLTGLL